MRHTGRYVAGIPFGILRHVGGQQDVDRSAVPYSRQGPAREADAHGPGGDPQHVGGLCDGIPRRPGRSTVLSHEGDTKPLGLGAPGPALHKAIYRDEGALHLKSADPKAPFLNQKSPSQRAKEEGVFCDPLHGSADSVVVAYCVEVWGGHSPWLRWRVETKGMPATLVAMGQWIEEGDREQVRV